MRIKLVPDLAGIKVKVHDYSRIYVWSIDAERFGIIIPELYASSYSIQNLKKVTNEIKAFRGVKEIYAYFNNDIHAEAIRNARQVQKLVLL